MCRIAPAARRCWFRYRPSVCGRSRRCAAAFLAISCTVAVDLHSKEAANFADAAFGRNRGPSQIALRPQKLPTRELNRVIRVHPKVLSGAAPDGPSAFAELRELGVQTIISVDGLTPDLAGAAEAGLRYVHLPHGYDGISMQRGKELAKAVRELPGVIYIHCHHGQHRSPAAAGVACRIAGWIEPDEASELLVMAGTSKRYRGLYEAVAAAEPVSAEALEQLDVAFQAKADVPPRVEAMAEIDVVYGRLTDAAAYRWQAPPDHPDLDPAHQALLLREHLTELSRTDRIGGASQAYQDKMAASVKAATLLERALRVAGTRLRSEQTIRALSNYHERLQASCVNCHRAYRDEPFHDD